MDEGGMVETILGKAEALVTIIFPFKHTFKTLLRKGLRHLGLYCAKLNLIWSIKFVTGRLKKMQNSTIFPFNHYKQVWKHSSNLAANLSIGLPCWGLVCFDLWYVAKMNLNLSLQYRHGLIILSLKYKRTRVHIHLSFSWTFFLFLINFVNLKVTQHLIG